MEALQWNEVLATGIEEIDDQHKRLLEILNQLRVAAERRERKEATAEVLQQMLDYTIYHFDYEEKL
ncbi:MAG: hemerythrin domain-containing protein, partial [Rhodocyclaceae bacterium]|nr:hemerythrin domain-containing protein [Rhodocyclaceae bacterium]